MKLSQLERVLFVVYFLKLFKHLKCSEGCCGVSTETLDIAYIILYAF